MQLDSGVDFPVTNSHNTVYPGPAIDGEQEISDYGRSKLCKDVESIFGEAAYAAITAANQFSSSETPWSKFLPSHSTEVELKLVRSQLYHHCLLLAECYTMDALRWVHAEQSSHAMN